MNPEELIEWTNWLLSRAGGDCIVVKYGDDPEVYGAIRKLIFHYTLLVGVVGEKDSFEDNWCYDTLAAAELALIDWSPTLHGEPQGWSRNRRTGRRRPLGDASLEYIAE